MNYNTRILGRHGVMEVALVAEPEELAGILPEFRKLMGSYRFTTGNTYAEFRSGDRIAEYGLTALVAGGAVAVAAKTGLLAKFGLLFAKLGKAAIVAVIAVVAVIGKVFKSIFGRRSGQTI